MPKTSALLLPFFLCGVPAGLPAQTQPAAQICTAAEHRQFDFWVGEWEVTGADGRRAGGSRITRVSNGCGILEEWSGASGSSGVSINYYDPAARAWNQHWVGAGGMILHLRGAWQDGSIVMHGQRQTAERTVKDRIRWVPEADGRVRQIWDVSSDDGKTWRPVFDGVYLRR